MSVFLDRKFPNELLHLPAHYHFLICDLSFCTDDIHTKVCPNFLILKPTKYFLQRASSWWQFFEESRGALKNLSCNTLNLFRVNRSCFDGEGGWAGKRHTNELLPSDGTGWLRILCSINGKWKRDAEYKLPIKHALFFPFQTSRTKSRLVKEAQ